jgi:hypothetical protein
MIEAVDCAMGAGEFPIIFEGKTLERDFIFEVSEGVDLNVKIHRKYREREEPPDFEEYFARIP